MSLVNDALKRATEVHNRRPPAPVPPLKLRPVEPEKKTGRGIGLVILATGLTVLVTAILTPLVMAHFPAPAPHPDPEPAASPIASTPAVTALAPAPEAEVRPVIAPPAPAAVVPVVVAPEAPPLPPSLRLQAVFYTPPHPSAIINGKTVRVGDSIQHLQVVAIGSSSVLLIGGNQTNFLTLE